MKSVYCVFLLSGAVSAGELCHAPATEGLQRMCDCRELSAYAESVVRGRAAGVTLSATRERLDDPTTRLPSISWHEADAVTSLAYAIVMPEDVDNAAKWFYFAIDQLCTSVQRR